MPQILPFFFVNQATFVLGGLAFTIFIVSVYLLPPYLHILVSRTYITKLLSINPLKGSNKLLL